MLVATEAAGEGINLQFCWFMINFDIPWNPVRLEQRIGRIHRYGQEHDCLIFNFVAVNTREGRVLAKLLDRLREIRKELGTDQVFDVVGEVFPANLLEKLFRDLYARKTNVPDIEDRIVRDVNPERFRAITESTLEGLAKRELNLSAIVGKSVEARERRLVPEVIEDFFVQAAPVTGIQPKAVAQGGSRLPRRQGPSQPHPPRLKLEPRFGHLGREYAKIVFDKTLLPTDPTLEWVTPGHPLFEAVREDVLDRVADHLRRGAVFFDLHRDQPGPARRLRRLDQGRPWQHAPPPAVRRRDRRGRDDDRTAADDLPGRHRARLPREPPLRTTSHLPDRATVEQFLLEHALQPFLAEVAGEREHQIETIRRHVEISLNTLDRPPEPPARRPAQPPDRGADRPGPRRADLPGRGPPRRAQRPARAAAPRTGDGAALHDRRHHPPRPGLGPAPPRADHAPARPDGPGRGDRADRRGVRDSLRGIAGLAGRERRVREPRLRPDLSPPPPRRPEDVRSRSGSSR